MLKLTDHKVVIEGKEISVTQDGATGRFYARVQDDENTSREWHAMDLDLLQIRINRTTEAQHATG
jgi:hypothetical protein